MKMEVNILSSGLRHDTKNGFRIPITARFPLWRASIVKIL